MEILINELSLEGQFSDFNDFRPSLIEALRIFENLKLSNCSLLRKYDFYNVKYSNTSILYDVLKTNDDAIVKFKSLLSEILSSNLSWEDSQKHDNSTEYYCKFENRINGYSLAEAYERDRLVFSFLRSKYSILEIPVKKGETNPVNIFNLYDYKLTLDWLLEKNLLHPDQYCKSYFKTSNLDFSYMEKEFGFDSLEKSQHKQFIDSFKSFSKMDWKSIISSDGLKYKKYSPSSSDANTFNESKYSALNIFKFRINELMRCFGYRKNDIFYVLRLENDHSVSDNG